MNSLKRIRTNMDIRKHFDAISSYEFHLKNRKTKEIIKGKEPRSSFNDLSNNLLLLNTDLK